jgi:hypothetical protein
LLGLANCEADEKRWRWAYLASFLLIQIYMLPIVPLVELVLDAIGFDAGCGCFSR